MPNLEIPNSPRFLKVAELAERLKVNRARSTMVAGPGALILKDELPNPMRF